MKLDIRSDRIIEITNSAGVTIVIIDAKKDGIAVEDFTIDTKIFQHRRVGKRFLFGSKEGHRDYVEVARQ